MLWWKLRYQHMVCWVGFMLDYVSLLDSDCFYLFHHKKIWNCSRWSCCEFISENNLWCLTKRSCYLIQLLCHSFSIVSHSDVAKIIPMDEIFDDDFQIWYKFSSTNGKLLIIGDSIIGNFGKCNNNFDKFFLSFRTVSFSNSGDKIKNVLGRVYDFTRISRICHYSLWN